MDNKGGHIEDSTVVNGEVGNTAGIHDRDHGGRQDVQLDASRDRGMIRRLGQRRERRLHDGHGLRQRLSGSTVLHNTYDVTRAAAARTRRGRLGAHHA